MAHDPLSPSEALRTPIGAVLTFVSLLAFAYSLVIAAQILLGVIVVALLSVGPYLSYRLFAALDSLADAAQRIADAREREVDRESRFGGATDHDSAASGREADRLTEREE